MGVLSKDEILAAVERGDIKITDFDASAVSGASVDLTLSNEFRVYNALNNNNGTEPVRVTEGIDYKEHTTLVKVAEGQGFLLGPLQSCLGITKEQITLPPTLCGLLQGRSRFARLGVAVHSTAALMNPGTNNAQVLEIHNSSPSACVRRNRRVWARGAGERAKGESEYAILSTPEGAPPMRSGAAHSGSCMDGAS